MGSEDPSLAVFWFSGMDTNHDDFLDEAECMWFLQHDGCLDCVRKIVDQGITKADACELLGISSTSKIDLAGFEAKIEEFAEKISGVQVASKEQMKLSGRVPLERALWGKAGKACR